MFSFHTTKHILHSVQWNGEARDISRILFVSEERNEGGYLVINANRFDDNYMKYHFQRVTWLKRLIAGS
jgi:hypothetical protein